MNLARPIRAISLLVLLSAGLPATGAEFKVVGEQACLRSGPHETAFLVAHVAEGDILKAGKGVDGEWVEVLAPPSITVWVYGDFVKDGVIRARTQVRSGPGHEYGVVGSLEKGHTIVEKGTYQEWLKIAPPDKLILWINRRDVVPVTQGAADKKPVAPRAEGRGAEPPPPAEAKTFPKVKAAEPAVVSRPEAPAAPPPAPRAAVTPPASPVRGRVSPADPVSSLRLASGMEQGKGALYTGTLRGSGFWVWRQPSRYHVVSRDRHGVASTVCFVVGNEQDLGRWEGQEVVVRGKEYWVQGVRYPAVVPDQMTPVKRSAE